MRIVSTTSRSATPASAAFAWSTFSWMRGAASSTESSMATMSGVAANASRTRLATRMRPSASGP
jgi:hypothetical protein